MTTVKYVFEPYGYTIPENIGDNEIWIDVGNKDIPAVFDHHMFNAEKKEECQSAFQACCTRLKLVSNDSKSLIRIKERILENKDVIIHTHISPDTDSIFSTKFFTDYLRLESSEFDNKYDECVKETLNKYIGDIDSGSRKVFLDNNLYHFTCALTDEKCTEIKDRSERSEFCIKVMSLLIDEIIEEIKNKKFDLENGDILTLLERLKEKKFKLVSGQEFAGHILIDIYKKIKGNYTRYNEAFDKELRDKNVIVCYVNIKQDESKRLYAWKQIPEFADYEYLIARNRGADFTFSPAEHSRILAFNRGKTESREISESVKQYLYDIATILELKEQVYDADYQHDHNLLPRDYSSSRGNNTGKNHFYDYPFKFTSDPWFVNLETGLVDKPGSGTGISIKENIEIICNCEKYIKQTKYVSFSWKDNTIKFSETFSLDFKGYKDWFASLQKTVKDKQDDKIHYLIVVEIDSRMIKDDNRILDACYMTVADNQYLNFSESMVKRIDYRTHLYVNSDFSLLFVSTSNDNDRMNRTLSTKTGNIIKNTLEEYYTYKGMMENDDLINNDKKRSNVRKTMVEQIAKSQRNSVLDNWMEREIYDYIQQAFKITETRELLSETFQIINEYSNDCANRTIERFETRTLPLVIACTIFSCLGLQVFNIEAVTDIWNIPIELFGGAVFILLIVIVYIVVFICTLLNKTK